MYRYRDFLRVSITVSILCALCLIGADELDSLVRALYALNGSVVSVPSWRQAIVYERNIGPVRLVVVVGDATSSDVPNSGQGPMLKGNMLNQDADVVVDAANGDIDPGTGVSGALYAAAGMPDMNGVWRHDRVPLLAGQKGSTSEKRLSDGQAWFNTHPEVLAYSPDKGTGAPQNIMRIIHAVAPMCGGSLDADLIISAYKNSLKEMDHWLREPDWLAKWNKQRKAAGVPLRPANHQPTIVFPLLGAGVFGCEPTMVAKSFLTALKDYVAEQADTAIRVVVLAPFNARFEEIVIGVVTE